MGAIDLVALAVRARRLSTHRGRLEWLIELHLDQAESIARGDTLAFDAEETDAHLRAAESLIAILDSVDGDPDREPVGDESDTGWCESGACDHAFSEHLAGGLSWIGAPEDAERDFVYGVDQTDPAGWVRNFRASVNSA